MKNIFNRLKMKLRGEVLTEELIANGMVVGKNFKRMQSCSFDVSHCWLITIGDDVTFAPNVKLIAHDASTMSITGHARIGCITIGDNVFVGNSVIILPDVTIGNNVVIGSGSVVTKNIPHNSVYAGNPAKLICSYEEFNSKTMDKFNSSPVYDKSFTIGGGISKEKKKIMKEALSNTTGFVR